MLQQGDVNITITKIPTGAKKRQDNNAMVREGEATGHFHKIVGTDFEMLELGDQIFARILSGDCSIVHEEHKPIELPVGDYEFTPTHEYDHFLEESKEVKD
jgi:uncharacterized cupin superfamily protein